MIFCYYTRIPGVCQAKIRVFFTFLSKFCTKKRGFSIRNPNHCGAFLKMRRFLDKALRQEYNKNGIRKKEVENLRIIHCADLHLGSKIQAKLPPDKAEIRRKEVRAAFENMLKFAYENRVSAVIIAGDAFDSDRPSLRDKRTFYDAAASYPGICFYYLRGNHDAKENGAYSEELPNLKTFGGEWTTYALRGRDSAGAEETVTVTGAELTANNAERLYSSLSLRGDSTNIVTLHGDIRGEIDLRRLKGKNIDYLALGHIHTYARGELDERGVYAYSGCLEGRGYDECGEKGFILLETGRNTAGRAVISSRFVPSSIRRLEEYRIDVSAAKDDFDARRIAERQITAREKDLLRVVLTGETGFDRPALEKTVREALERKYFFVTVKDETRAKCDFSEIAKENSLKGEFVRLTLSRTDMSAEEKDAAIRLGIGALERGTAEL